MIRIDQNHTVYVGKTSANINPIIQKILNHYPQIKNIKKGGLVLIKPNWVCARSSETGATTTHQITEEVIKFFQKKGARVVIGEGSGYEFDTEKIFKVLEVEKISKKYNVPIYNLRNTKNVKVNIGGKCFKTISLPEIVTKADLIVSIPKLKTHALTDITFGLKNLYGLLPDPERRRGHLMGIHQPLVDLNKYFTNVLTILDAIYVMGGSGPVFGDTIKSNLIAAGCNTFAVDKVACDIVKIDYKKIAHLRYANNQGLIPMDIKIDGEKKAKINGFNLPIPSQKVRIGYWFVYLADELQYHFTKKSYIPKMITWLGTKLQIDQKKCTGCGKCRQVCPVNAITNDYIVDFEKCRHVRCFKCWEICPKSAFIISGISKPKEKSE